MCIFMLEIIEENLQIGKFPLSHIDGGGGGGGSI